MGNPESRPSKRSYPATTALGAAAADEVATARYWAVARYHHLDTPLGYTVYAICVSGLTPEHPV